MKKILNKILLITVVLGIISLSCSEDFLDQNPVSSTTDLTYYKTVSQLNTGLTACYSQLLIMSAEAVRSPFCFPELMWAFGNVCSDDAEKGGENATDQASLGEVSNIRALPTNYWVETLWSMMYKLIARCNQVIEKSVQTQGDAAEIEKIVDQAKALRAIGYYYLVTSFGEVPLITNFLYPNELTLEKSPVADIWAQIESDLLDATNLPAKSASQIGRITSGVVYGLLGKVYLTQEKYAQANSAYYKVVKSGVYSLVSDYGSIFRHEGENNAESILEIQYKNGVSGGDFGTFGSVLRMSRDSRAGGYGFDCPTQNLVDEYEDGDPRKLYTIIFRGDSFPTKDPALPYRVTNTSSPTTYQNRKAWIPWAERGAFTAMSWDLNWRYMRYAEILLFYAESLNEVGKPDSAVMLVNMIRARARATPTTDPQRISSVCDLSYSGDLLPDVVYTTQDALREAIWHEQRIELAEEGLRRNILLRTGRYKTAIEAVRGSSGVVVDPYEWLLPIPQVDIDRSNGVITQNEGY